MAYETPGRADKHNESLVERWNQTIVSTYSEIFAADGSRFITPDPDSLEDPENVDVKWFADPAEPNVCLDRTGARVLCDWRGGRRRVQDEYAEYAVEQRPDADGRIRPKRVQITTELREYWQTIAIADPEALAGTAEDALGRRPSFTELYGHDDPHALDESQREAAFVNQLVGGAAGAAGELNAANALFMLHRINGLDDLIGIVMLGAKPYSARDDDGNRRAASRDEIFSLHPETRILACRHADPIAASRAHAAAFDGRTVAFANPIGMYIKSFDHATLTLDGQALPPEWIRFGRGQAGMHQRLVVGPPDDDEHFLDDITVSAGAANEPLLGGFQLLELTEVGPLVLQGKSSPLAESDFVDVPALKVGIDCAESFACDQIVKLKAIADRELESEQTGRRSAAKPSG
jgi:hypothetical protein